MRKWTRASFVFAIGRFIIVCLICGIVGHRSLEVLIVRFSVTLHTSMPEFDPLPGDTPWDRGRLTALDYRRLLEVMHGLVQVVMRAHSQHIRNGRRRRRTRARGRQGTRVLVQLCVAMGGHVTSHDNVLRPRFVASGPRVNQPWATEVEATFKLNTRFSRQDFADAVGWLTLIPNALHANAGRHGCGFPKALGMYMVMRRFATGGRWETIQREMNIPRSTCCTMFTTTIAAVYEAYYDLTRTLDCRRIQPKLREWVASLAADGVTGTKDVRFVTDGKGWPWAKPGTGMAAQRLAATAAAQAGVGSCFLSVLRRCWLLLPVCAPLCVSLCVTVRDHAFAHSCTCACAVCPPAGLGHNVNLLQRAHHNGNYRFHGAKVQHLLQMVSRACVVCVCACVRVCVVLDSLDGRT